jgi:hypothetical protein
MTPTFPLVRGVSTSKEGNRQESTLLIDSTLYAMFSLPILRIVLLSYLLRPGLKTMTTLPLRCTTTYCARHRCETEILTLHRATTVYSNLRKSASHHWIIISISMAVSAISVSMPDKTGASAYSRLEIIIRISAVSALFPVSISDDTST